MGKSFKVTQSYRPLLVDINRLKTVPNYAKFIGISERGVRYQIESGAVVVAEIDGRIFVHLSDEQFQTIK